ncbi:MAG: ATP-binding protein [Cyanobacteria bacterium J06639_18]
MSGIVTAANCLLAIADYDDSIDAALAALGESAFVDRVYVFENHFSETGEPLTSQRWEWVKPGITPEIDNPLLQNVVYQELCPGWYEKLSQGRSIIGLVKDFPEPEREILASQGIHSIFVMPIQIKGEFWGFIGFDDCQKERQWSGCEQLILKSAVGNLGAAIARHHTEVKLRESQQLLQLVMDNIPQFVFWKDCDSVYLGCNRKFARAAGVGEPERIIGLSDYDLPWKASETDWFREWDRRVMRSGVPQLNIVEIESSIFLIRDETTGKHIYTASIGRDIRDRKIVEMKLKQQAEELEQSLFELRRTQAQLIHSEKMSSLGQMVAGIAHEINNPVSFVYGNLNPAFRYFQDLLRLIELYQRLYPHPPPEIQAEIETMELDFLKQDLTKLLESMQEGTRRIKEIVISLRNFSRLDESEFKKVNIHDGIDSTLMILRNRLKAKPNRPEIAIAKHYGCLPLVYCYPSQLNQAFMNILSNAIDALDEHSKTLSLTHLETYPSRIHISTEHIGENRVAIKIMDNGPGIATDIQDRLFEPFFTTKDIGNGTGLGLSISYQIIVEKHGGKLSCQSNPGQGTEFLIEIPITHAVNSS